MKIHIGKGKKAIKVEVLNKYCPQKECFHYGRYTHHSASGMSGCSSWTDENMSCLRRDTHGCPDNIHKEDS